MFIACSIRSIWSQERNPSFKEREGKYLKMKGVLGADNFSRATKKNEVIFPLKACLAALAWLHRGQSVP